MFRTIQEAHSDFKLLVDRVASPRWDSTKIDRFLNFSQDAIIQDRYDNFKQRKNYSFQAFQRVRDELRSLVIGPVSLFVVSGNIYAYPEDYRHTLLLRTTIDTFVKAAPPITYDELAIIGDDPFESPEPEFPKSIENQVGIEVLFGQTGNLTLVELFFIKNPLRIDLGFSQTSQFPGHLHDEWIEYAAKLGAGTVENYNRYKLLKQEALEA